MTEEEKGSHAKELVKENLKIMNDYENLQKAYLEIQEKYKFMVDQIDVYIKQISEINVYKNT